MNRAGMVWSPPITSLEEEEEGGVGRRTTLRGQKGPWQVQQL